MLPMKRRSMKGKYVTDSGSENVDAEKKNEPEEETPDVVVSPNVKPLPGTPGAPNIVGLSLTEHSVTEHTGPPWANPEILKDLSPEMKNDLLKSALEAASKRDENRFQFVKQKLGADTDNEKRNQWFGLGVLIVVLLACGGLSWLFLTFGAKELITPVLTGLGGLGAGFAGGYGFGKRSGKDS